jgi:hypothetical protein
MPDLSSSSRTVADQRATLTRAAVTMTRALALESQRGAALHQSRSSIEESVRTGAEREALREELRVIVCAYVATLRAGGLPPEQTLRLVKTAIEPAMGYAAEGAASRAVVEDAVRWCVEEYYAG